MRKIAKTLALQIPVVKNWYASLQQERSESSRRLEELRNENSRLLNEKERLLQERDELSQDNKRLRTDCDTLSQERDMTTALYSQSNELLQAKQRECAELAQQLASTYKDFEQSYKREALLRQHVNLLDMNRLDLLSAQTNLTARIMSKIELLQSSDFEVRKLLLAAQSNHRGTERMLQLHENSSYLDLLENVLTGIISEDEPECPHAPTGFDPDVRLTGRDWPKTALTMIGKARLRNFRTLIETVIDDAIPGDIIETGVWRGGACILARALLKMLGVKDRTVWVADSFCGLPEPNPVLYPADEGDSHHAENKLNVPLDEVKRNFERFGLLDSQVGFLEGWFKDTLPSAPIDKLAIMRLDGDMYESTMDALSALYDRLSPGGFVIIDDYCLPNCKHAVSYFRELHSINEPLLEIDNAAVYWRKESHAFALAIKSPSEED